MESCSFCGREVAPTVHRREGDQVFRVDYYRLLTGALSRIAIQDPRDEKEQLEFYKLSNPQFVVSCSDCINKEDVLFKLERMFSGVPEDETNVEPPG